MDKEREYCHRVVFGRGPTSLTNQTDEMVRERVAARAECQLEIERLRAELAEANKQARINGEDWRKTYHQLTELRDAAASLIEHVGTLMATGEVKQHCCLAERARRVRRVLAKLPSDTKAPAYSDACEYDRKCAPGSPCRVHTPPAYSDADEAIRATVLRVLGGKWTPSYLIGSLQAAVREVKP